MKTALAQSDTTAHEPLEALGNPQKINELIDRYLDTGLELINRSIVDIYALST
jgi:hypothetical protein